MISAIISYDLGDYCIRSRRLLHTISAQAKFDEYLGDYNVNTTKPMNLVFFKDACLHLARISRVISQA